MFKCCRKILSYKIIHVHVLSIRSLLQQKKFTKNVQLWLFFFYRWQKMSGGLHDRLSMLEACLAQWQQYEQEYNKARRWLDAKERLCNELVSIREDANRRDECLSESKVNDT